MSLVGIQILLIIRTGALVYCSILCCSQISVNDKQQNVIALLECFPVVHVQLPCYYIHISIFGVKVKCKPRGVCCDNGFSSRVMLLLLLLLLMRMFTPSCGCIHCGCFLLRHCRWLDDTFQSHQTDAVKPFAY